MTQEPVPVYLDNQASTPMDPRVLRVMVDAMYGVYANPHSSEHAEGWKAGGIVDDARATIAGAIGALPEEIVFTSGATESNNIALLGGGRALPVSRRHVAVSAIEHKSVLGPAKALAAEGWLVDLVPVDSSGQVDLDALARSLHNGAALVSVMLVNNEVGTLQPIAEISSMCRAAGAIFHADAAQALSWMPLDVEELGVDLLSLSGHKAYGPKGVGALYVGRNLHPRPLPLMHGGEQEGGLRPGTLAPYLCTGLAEACSISAAEGSAAAEKMAGLRDTIKSLVLEAIPGAVIVGAVAERHPGNLSIRFPGIDAGRLIGSLQPWLAISSGSACTSGVPESSHVLLAMGMNHREASEVIRVAVSKMTTLEEAERAGRLIADAALRATT
ncbi:MAG TPA: cysteine desulfurase family protein [Azospirillaceae bacterium]|nr:cysteine desulfurase family protein [Azospirillaceae bacterium]